MIAALAGHSNAFGQAADEGRKQARAVRLDADAIRLDGRLDEPAWRDVPAITDFIQKEPVEGAPPTDAMEIRIAYDDDALYVGARMLSSGAIQAPMGRRDEGDQAEHLVVSLDTYLDRRTASTFGITAAGVRLDQYYASDDDGAGDEGYSPIWEGRVSIDAQGWTAELWIPFSQLRFNDRSPQVWGLNIQRWVPSRNEEVFWALVSRTEERWASLFGDLHGIEGIRPRRRLELLPYAAGSSHLIGNRDPADPFTGGANLEGRLGLDAKVGLGSNLTLEATVNPDFGQVEADPAEVNLSAFETFFDERRTFFLEGSQLLTGTVNNYFYSRRIGATPAGPADAAFVEYPSTSTILGAAKLTGRLASGTSVGMLGAVTGGESARTVSGAGEFGRVRVAPRTIYGVARVEQEFGAPGSTVGLMTTFVHRDLATGDPLSALLARTAFSLSSDAVMRLNDGEYEARLYAGGSFVQGDAPAIDRLQRSSARYFHRPDATHVTYDPARTTLFGTKSGASIERRTGRHWLWGAETQIESPGFETNDLGRTTSSDAIGGGWRLEYRETVPGRWWRDYSIAVAQEQEWNFARDRQQSLVGLGGRVTWPNFWETDVEATFNFRAQDSRLTRGGPSMETPRQWIVNVDMENANASRTRGELSATYGRDEEGGLTFGTGTRLALRPGAQWQLSVRPSYERRVDPRQYVTTRDDGPEAAYGGRYIFARIDRSTYATEIRLNYTFKPDLTLDLYAEPFAASGRYMQFGELEAARSRFIRWYGSGGTSVVGLDDGSLAVTDGEAGFILPNRDFNVRSFRSNLVLRWEWRAGSTLYLVWQQDRAADEPIGDRATITDMFGSLNTRGDTFFAVKASFWFSPD